jgi:conjugal transfer/entry exclusion protein
MHSSQDLFDVDKSDQDGPDKEEEVEIVEGNEAQESSDVSSTMDLIEDKVRILDEEFTNLSKLEQTLKDLLHLLQSEEETLRIALSQASETLIAKRARQRKERETEAISRLEAALGLDTDSNNH